MTYDELLQALLDRNIAITVTDKLRVDAPVGSLDEQLKAALRHHKDLLMAEFSDQTPEADLRITGKVKYPMTAEQRGIFQAYQLLPDTDTYHMPAIMHFEGTVNLTVLREAIIDLGLRHKTIISRYFFENGEYWQQHIDGAFPVVNQTQVEDEPSDHKNCREAFFAQEFRLEKGDVFKALMVKRNHQHVELLLNLHHIAADGWSIELLKRDLVDNYTQRTKNGIYKEQQQPGFIDYIDWLKAQNKPGKQEFWQKYLASPNFGPRLTLSAKPQTGVKTSGYSVFRLGAQYEDMLEQVAKRYSATAYHIWVALVSAVLGRLQENEDIFVLTPQMRRSHPQSNEIVGLLLENFIIRSQIDWQNDFSALVTQIRDAHYNIQNYGAHELEQLASYDASSTGESGNDNPFLRYSVNMLNYEKSSLKLEGIDVSVEALPPTKAKYDLTLYIQPEADNYQVHYHFDTQYFDADVMVQLHEKFLSLIAQAFKNPQAELRHLFRENSQKNNFINEAISLTSGHSKQAVSPVDQDKSLLNLIIRQCKTDGQKIAIESSQSTISYQQMELAVLNLVQQLKAQGVAPGKILGIAAQRKLELPIAILAAWTCGSAYTCFDLQQPPKRIEQLLELSVPDVIVCFSEESKQQWQSMTKWAEPVFVIDINRLLSQPSTSQNWHSQAETLSSETPACITFTSGSTGKPKAVVGKHGALVSHISEQAQKYKWSATDRFSFLSGLQNDPSQRDMFNPLSIGATLCIPDESEIAPQSLTSWVHNSSISVMHLTPALGRYLSAPTVSETSEQIDLKALRWVLSSGDVLYWKDVQSLSSVAANCSIVNLFGSTETQRASTEYLCYQAGVSSFIPTDGVVPIGILGPGVRAEIVNAQGEPALPLEVGEIYLLSDHLALGYKEGDVYSPLNGVNSPTHTQANLGTSYYATGDFGRRLGSGAIAYAGRKDSQSNVNGFRVSMLEIEKFALQHKAITAAKAWINRLSEVDQLWLHCQSSDSGLHSDTVVQYLKTLLPPYAIPHRLTVSDSMPMTSARKVDTQAINRQFESQSKVQHCHYSDEQQIVVNVWQDCLKVKNIQPGDDFFCLGGNSLLALTISEKLQSLFGIHYPLSQFLETPSLAECLSFFEPHLLAPGDVSDLSDQNFWQTDSYKKDEAFPLTLVQESYWMGRSGSFNLGNVTTSAYVELQFNDPENAFDLSRVQWVLNQLLQRHPMLRMQVTSDGKQHTLSNVQTYELAVQDLTGMDCDAEQRLMQWRNIMRAMEFDVHQFPLFDIRCSILKPQQVLLHIKVDLLLLDYWSGQIILREFEQLYFSEEKVDCESVLPTLSANFSDYIAYLNCRSESQQYQRAKRYWQDRLESLPQAPELPVSKDQGESLNAEFVRRVHLISKERWQAVEVKAAQISVTPSSILMGLFTAVLGRWTQQESMTINLTLFDRPAVHPQINQIVGDFTSLLPLAVESNKKSFNHHIRCIQQQLFKDLEYRAYSGVEVIRDKIKTSGIADAVFPVVFTNHLGMSKTLTNDEQDTSRYFTQTFRESKSSQVWLDHVVGDESGGVSLVWNTLDALFPKDMMAQMFTSYIQYVDFMVDNLDAWSKPINLPLPGEYEQMIFATNQTHQPFEYGLLHNGFLEQVEQQPERPAIVTPQETLSYDDLYVRACTIAVELQKQAVCRGEVVAVSYVKSAEQVAATIAVLMVGATYLPLDPGWPLARCQSIKQQADFKVLLTDQSDTNELAKQLSVKVILSKQLTRYESSKLNTQQWLDNSNQSDLAYIIFTSGSTGVPKGVAMTHQSVDNTLQAINQQFSVSSDDRVFAISALHFDLSVYDIFGVLAVGASIFIPDAKMLETPSTWQDAVAQFGVTVWNSVPALMQLAVNSDDINNRESKGANNTCSNLRLVMLSGDWIPLTLPQEIKNTYENARLVSLGGATEAAIWSISYAVEGLDPNWRSIPYGKALPNQKMWVLNKQFQVCPQWMAGDIYISGFGLAREYYGDKKRTNASFVVHPETGERLYRTGDMGRYIADGNIEFLGRLDHQVKINGYRIELGDIEIALTNLADIDTAVALAIGETQGNKQLIAIVVVNDSQVNALDDKMRMVGWRNELNNQLPPYMLPQQYIVVEEIPLTSNGKVDRKKLLAVAQEQHLNRPSIEMAALSDAAKMVLPFWQEVLPDADISSGCANFFQLGGNSLMALQLLTKINQSFDIELSVSDLFTVTSLNDFADCVRVKQIEQNARALAQQSIANAADIELESGEL